MSLPLRYPFPPMEAASVDALPEGQGWQYEPKWDGFRCLAFRDQDELFLQSKSGQPLARYFPDVIERLHACRANQFVLDGERLRAQVQRVDQYPARLATVFGLGALTVRPPATAARGSEGSCAAC